MTQSLNQQKKKKSKHVNSNIDIADEDVCESSKYFSAREACCVGIKPKADNP
jgi:hypothetical protein